MENYRGWIRFEYWGNVLILQQLRPRFSSITWSHGFQGGSMSNVSLEKTSSNPCRYFGIFTLTFSCFWDATRCCKVVPVAWRCSSGWRFTYSRCSPPSRVSSGPRETTLESKSSESKPSESEPSNSSSKSNGWGPEQQTWTRWSTLCCSCHCFHMSIKHVWHLSGH